MVIVIPTMLFIWLAIFMIYAIGKLIFEIIHEFLIKLRIWMGDEELPKTFDEYKKQKEKEEYNSYYNY